MRSATFLALQAKMLRFLQQRVIERVGGREEIPVDVRIVCATHQHLKNLIGGRFREDLYSAWPKSCLIFPALRERKGDASPCSRIRATLYRGAEAQLFAASLMPSTRSKRIRGRATFGSSRTVPSGR